MLIPDHLHFDVARVDDHFFEIDIGIAETDFRFGPRCGKLTDESS